MGGLIGRWYFHLCRSVHMANNYYWIFCPIWSLLNFPPFFLFVWHRLSLEKKMKITDNIVSMLLLDWLHNWPKILKIFTILHGCSTSCECSNLPCEFRWSWGCDLCVQGCSWMAGHVWQGCCYWLGNVNLTWILL